MAVPGLLQCSSSSGRDALGACGSLHWARLNTPMRLLSGQSMPLQTAALARTRKIFAILLLTIQASAVTRAMYLATTSANAREQLRGHSRVHPARLHRALGFVIYVENEAHSP